LEKIKKFYYLIKYKNVDFKYLCNINDVDYGLFIFQFISKRKSIFSFFYLFAKIKNIFFHLFKFFFNAFNIDWEIRDKNIIQ
jgi:hypothetical protein